MADNDSDKERAIGIEDILSVRSRVSWGAVLAGAVVALATSLILSLLGTAIGLSIDSDVDGDTFSAGAALWALISTIIAMFLGGWITCLCAVGETKREAVVHGIITWGVVLAMGLWLAASGVSAGASAMAGLAESKAGAGENADWTQAARAAGVSQQTLDQWRQSSQDASGQSGQQERNNTAQAARDTASTITWWTLAGTILSMASAIVGALVGAGPSLHLAREHTGHSYIVQHGQVRQAM